MPIIAQLFLPAVLIYCGAQRRKRGIFLQAAGDWEKTGEISKGEDRTELLGSRSVACGIFSFIPFLYTDNDEICFSPI